MKKYLLVLLLILGINLAGCSDIPQKINDKSVSSHKAGSAIKMKDFRPTSLQLDKGKANIVKRFPEVANDLRLVKAKGYVLESKDIKFILNKENQSINQVIFLTVDDASYNKIITKDEGRSTAVNFLKKRFPEIDLNNFTVEEGISDAYIYHFQEFDQKTKVKLLDSVTVVVNPGRNEVAEVDFNFYPPPASLKITLDKAAAEKIALKAVENEFSDAKLIRASDTPEVKLFVDDPKGQRIGWIFIYENNKLSAAIFVDVNTGKPFIQRQTKMVEHTLIQEFQKKIYLLWSLSISKTGVWIQSFGF